LRFAFYKQAKIFVYSKNRIFPKNPVFLKILCPKIYGTLLIRFSLTAHPHPSGNTALLAICMLFPETCGDCHPVFRAGQRMKNRNHSRHFYSAAKVITLKSD